MALQRHFSLMLRLFRSRARHGFRAFSLTSYLLMSPALADFQWSKVPAAGGHATSAVVVLEQGSR